jgi:hypothetical protein
MAEPSGAGRAHSELRRVTVELWLEIYAGHTLDHGEQIRPACTWHKRSTYVADLDSSQDQARRHAQRRA